MGFSVSGATAVVFIGLLICAGILYPSVDRYSERRSDAMTERSESALSRHNTGVDPGNASWNATTDTLTVTANNSGAATLAVSELDVLVDGEYVDTDASQTTVENTTATDLWHPGERLTIRLASPADPGRVKLVTGPGVAVTMAVGGA